MNIKITLPRLITIVIGTGALSILFLVSQALATEITTTNLLTSTNLDCTQFGWQNSCSISVYNQAIPTFILALSGVLCGLFIWDKKYCILSIFIILFKIVIGIILFFIGSYILLIILQVIISST